MDNSQSTAGNAGYTGTASLTALRPGTGNPIVDGVLSGVQWPTLNLSIFFPSNTSAYSNYPTQEPQSFAQLTTAQIESFNFGMALVSDYTNLTFTQGAFNTSMIRFANFTASGGQSHGYYPDGFTTSGDIWMGNLNNQEFGPITNPVPGDFNFATHLHELGHALGLSHGHANGINDDGSVANDGNGNPIPNTGVLPTAYDNWNWSTMTYRSYAGAQFQAVQGGRNDSNPITFMPADILALQVMYGPNYSGITSTDSVWRWDTNGFFSINGNPNVQAANGKMLMTVWDGGGNDTYDFSLHSANQAIDLRPGAFSTFNPGQLADLDFFTPGVQAANGNVANAFQFGGDLRSLIENAIAGSGNDMLRGNQVNNRLEGRDGNDSIDGGLGGDTMLGGLGNDVYVVDNVSDIVGEFANQGSDTIYSSIDFTLNGNVEVGIVSVATGAHLIGNESDNFLFGSSGADILDGAYGTDLMQGGAGNDTYAIDNSFDAVVEAAGGGFDNVYSSVDYFISSIQEIESGILTGNAVQLRGSSSANRLTGNDKANVIDGRGGVDYLLGLGGDDIFQINLDGSTDVIGDFTGAGVAGGDRLVFAASEFGANGVVSQLSQTSFQVARADGSFAQQFILANLTDPQTDLIAHDDYYFA